MREANLDPEDPRVRTAVFGKQVEDFLHGEIGDYLIKSAERTLERLIDELKKVAANDTTAIIRLQCRIEYLERFQVWLGAAVQDGLTAQRILNGEEDLDA